MDRLELTLTLMPLWCREIIERTARKHGTTPGDVLGRLIQALSGMDSNLGPIASAVRESYRAAEVAP